MNRTPPTLDELLEVRPRLPDAGRWVEVCPGQKLVTVLHSPSNLTWPPSEVPAVGDTVRTVEFTPVAFRRGDGPVVWRWVYTGDVLMDALPSKW